MATLEAEQKAIMREVIRKQIELDEMKITCENEVSRAHSAVDKQRAMMRQQARILLYTNVPKNLPPSLCDR